MRISFSTLAKTLVGAAAVSLPVLIGAAPAPAADLLTYDRHGAERRTAHRAPAHHASYAPPGAVCQRLHIKYRPPHEPRSEVVTVCHPPLRWDQSPLSLRWY